MFPETLSAHTMTNESNTFNDYSPESFICAENKDGVVLRQLATVSINKTSRKRIAEWLVTSVHVTAPFRYPYDAVDPAVGNG